MPYSTLEEVLQSIELDAQYLMAILWTKKGLPIWERFASNPDNLSYTESTGKLHKVDKNLVNQALAVTENEQLMPGTDSGKFSEVFNTLKIHVDSIDCLDWKLPNDVERIICAVFNLLQLYRKHFIDDNEEAQLNMVINQAADALLSGNIKTVEELIDELFRIKKYHSKPEGAIELKPDQPPKLHDVD